jgi:hypothetical protein
MTESTRLTALRAVLGIVGVVSLAGVYPLMRFWPSGWQWQPSQPEYELMIVGVYAVLGVYLLLAMREPWEHRSLLGFAAWSSLVHGGIMAAQALADPAERGHLLGDVPVLLIAGVALLALMPRKRSAATA